MEANHVRGRMYLAAMVNGAILGRPVRPCLYPPVLQFTFKINFSNEINDLLIDNVCSYTSFREETDKINTSVWCPGRRRPGQLGYYKSALHSQ